MQGYCHILAKSPLSTTSMLHQGGFPLQWAPQSCYLLLTGLTTRFVVPLTGLVQVTPVVSRVMNPTRSSY